MEKLDPRAAIAGRNVSSSGPGGEAWVSGLFDRGSWMECQAGWARSVVTGRARLGGVPVGIIAVETQTVMLNIPADPGAPDSSERIIPQVRLAFLHRARKLKKVTHAPQCLQKISSQ